MCRHAAPRRPRSVLPQRYPHQFFGASAPHGIGAHSRAAKILVCDESSLHLMFNSASPQSFSSATGFESDASVHSHDSGGEHLRRHHVSRPLVELAPTEALFGEPNHPYTQALLANVPRSMRAQRFGTTRAKSPRRSRRARLPLPPALLACLRALQDERPARKRSRRGALPPAIE